jgi:TIR domain
MELEKPLAFISHDSKDKREVAGPIAVGLQKLMCPVWYDEFSLNVGDHLRESIERGLKEAKKFVLILSPNFFSNNSWTKTEVNSIFTREILEQKSVVLPDRRRSTRGIVD